MSKLLKEACYAVFAGLADTDLYSEAYSALKTLVWVAVVLVVRLVMLALFPITVPLVLLLLIKKQKKLRAAEKYPISLREKPRFEYRDVDGVRYGTDTWRAK